MVGVCDFPYLRPACQTLWFASGYCTSGQAPASHDHMCRFQMPGIDTAMEFMIHEWAVGFLQKCRQSLGRLEFCLFALSALRMCQHSPGEIFTCSTCLTNTFCAQLTFKQLSQRRYLSNLFPVQLNYSVGSLLSAAVEPIHSLIRRAD
jgi:hypothetical protein